MAWQRYCGRSDGDRATTLAGRETGASPAVSPSAHQPTMCGWIEGRAQQFVEWRAALALQGDGVVTRMNDRCYRGGRVMTTIMFSSKNEEKRSGPKRSSWPAERLKNIEPQYQLHV